MIFELATDNINMNFDYPSVCRTSTCFKHLKILMYCSFLYTHLSLIISNNYVLIQILINSLNYAKLFIKKKKIVSFKKMISVQPIREKK